MSPARPMLFLVLLGTLACDVEPTGHDTGGIEDEARDGCPRGITVLLSDYASTQIALSDLSGQTLSESLISSGSRPTTGLSQALSGDVVLPSTPPRSGLVVLIDRFGTNVITWVDPRSGEVLDQLTVGTGFESNPQDYLELDDERALVTRWGTDPAPGTEPNDGGSDVLVIHPPPADILDRLAIPVRDGFPPRPSSMTRIGEEVVVTLDRVSGDFRTTGNAMLVGVSVDDLQATWELTLSSEKGCGKLISSPDGRRLALACSGAVTPEGEVADPSESAILTFEPGAPPRLLERYAALDLVGEPIQSELEFATDSLVLFKTQTALGAAGDNRWMALDLDSGQTEVLLAATPGVPGLGWVYGGMACAPGCSSVCLLADGETGVLQRASVGSEEGSLLLEPVRVERAVGLPPRDLSPRY